MVSDWVEARLDEVTELIIDCPHSTPKWMDEGVSVLRSSNIKNGRLDLSSPSFTNEAGYQDRVKRAVPQADDIVLTREAPMGEVCKIPEGLRCCLGQRMVLLRVNKELMDSTYLLVALQSPYLKHQISWNEGTGTTVSNIRIPNIKAFQIPTPPLPEQKAIAHILGSLDDKIELNRQMNETLEAMAQALFKSWFVDFDPVLDNALAAGNPIPDELLVRSERRQALPTSDTKNLAIRALFPDAFEFTEEMGWIPEGWNITKVLDLSEKLTKGTTPSKADLSKAKDEASIPFLKVMNIDNNGFIKAEKLENIPKSIHEGSLKRSIVREGDVLFSIAGTIGRTSIIPKKLDNSNINQAVAFIRLKDSKKPNFLLQLLKSEEVQNIVHSKIVQAVQANFSLTELGNLILAEPSNNVFDSWIENTESIFIKISDLQDNTFVLAKLRDTLLPKLLSGELRIADAAALVEDA